MSALAVITLSSPDDSAYRIPDVGTGRRSQFYVLHGDGTYKYGYDTGEGAYESARSQSVNEVDGQFGYRDPDGNNIHLQYQAGQEGFVPTGAHLPQPHPDFAAAHAEARARPPFRDPLADSNTDASYDFQYAEGGQARSEQSDSQGNIQGSYTYTDEEGRTRTYTYTAGRETGFVVQGDDLPQAPLAPGQTPAATQLSASGRRPSSSAFRSTPSFPSQVSRTPSAPSSSFRSSTTSHAASQAFSGARASSSGTYSSQASGIRPDGSYSFSYDAGDHSRSESADSDLNVEGQFSFVADDGVRRRVDYEAGRDTGFLAFGDHLPQPHDATQAGARASTSSFASTRTSSRTPTTSATSSFRGAPSTYQATSPRRPTFTSPSATRRQPFEEANTRTQLNPDGSYSFAYETSSHSRAESGDRDNNVQGNFDFVADDGQRRAIEYVAGEETGFIAKGDHIPVGPVVPGAPSGQPTGDIVAVQEVPFIDPLANTGDDASYDFAFESEQYSRSETADAEGNVQGQYTVVDDDGTRRTYRFRAGKGVGYETEEVSRSQGPRPSTRPTAGFRSPSTSFTGTHAPATSFTGHPAPSTSFTGSPAPATSFSSRPSAFRTGQTHATFSPTRGASTSGFRSEASSDFQLHQYDASENSDKFGYVLTFN